MSSAGKDAISDFEKVAKVHETELVIELGVDRLIKWAGVYLVLALAVIAKLADSIGPTLSCYPQNITSSYSGKFIKFASSYCWSTEFKNQTPCSIYQSTTNLIQNPNSIKFLINWLPYLMLAQAFVYSIGPAYWHFRVGGRLIGHIKFMQLLLNAIFEKLKTIPKGNYNREPYNKDSSRLNGLRTYPSEDTSNCFSLCIAKDVTRLTDPADDQSEASEDPEQYDPPFETKGIDKYLYGNIRDRHLFSMMCYENFASLHHIPFILSVFQLSERKNVKPETIEPPVDFYDLHESMLYQWCHHQNLDNIFLIQQYFYKSVLMTFLPAIVIVIIMISSIYQFSSDIASSNVFECELSFESMCVLCSIERKSDTIFIYFINFFINICIAFFSLGNWLVIRWGDKLSTCHYFDDMKHHCNVAFDVARFEAKKKET